MFASAVCAADLNNGTEANDDLGASDDVILEDTAKDVNLTTRETIGIYGNNQTRLQVQVTDSEGNKVTGGSLTFVNVFGRNYTVDVTEGIAKSKVFVADTGIFDITCNYVGTDFYKNATTKLLLNVPFTNTTCKNIVATRYDNTVYFSGNIVSNYTAYQPSGDVDDYEEVTVGNLTVYVNGAELGTCDLDINGNFVYIWNATKNLIGETISFTGRYNGDERHFNSTVFSRNFTFEAPKATQISADAKAIDDYTTLISGIVNDESGKAVLGGTLTINNRYSVIVDANGRFTFYVTNKTIRKANYTIGVEDFGSKADITINEPLMNAITHTELVDQIIELCKQGSPYIKFGNGNGKTIVVNVGIHGAELASQVAGFKLIDLLANYGGDIDGTIYVFPVIFPEATANNVRVYNGINLNTVADINGSISNNLIKFAQSVNAVGLGDFHCTRHSDSDVGITCVMGSFNPTPESGLIAQYIHNQTGYDLDMYEVAGVPYAGAVEDKCNLLGLPAITSETLTNHKAVEYGSPEVSLNMMRSFLRYFGFDVDDMMKIPYEGNSLSLAFSSPYNYNSSTKSVRMPSYNIQVIAENAAYTINYGGKYSVTLKDSNGILIKGKTVTFILNGKNIGTDTTDAKGVATVQLTAKILKAAKAGSKNLVIKFVKADKKSVEKTVKIKINKEKTKIFAKNKAFKRTLKVKKYSIALKDSKGKAVKKMWLSIKIGKKTFKAKTNAKGKAVFEIKKITKKATYKAKITFKGNDYYSKLSKTVKIKIK
jgi:predicted deacylase